MENYVELLKRNEIVYKEYQKSVKHLGEVYAVITRKGYAIAQVAGVNYHGGQICRIFSKQYKEVPVDIQSIIDTKEDYLLNIQLSGMAHWRVKQAMKLGRYEIPSFFEIPKYYRGCTAFGEKPAPFTYWSISNYKGDILLLDDFILNVLHKELKDESWKKDFLTLNPTYYCNGPDLIEKLEYGFTLEKWRPTDFDKKTKDILKEEKILMNELYKK